MPLTLPRFLSITATRTQALTYLLGIALFSISFLVFLNSSISFVITDVIGRHRGVGDAVGTLGFADELVALVACPIWGIVSDRVGVRAVAVAGYALIGVALCVLVQARNVYPQLLLARLLFSVGGAASATMVTAILPSMTLPASSISSQDEHTPGSANPNRNSTHTLSPSISSELTITPARFQSHSPVAEEAGEPGSDNGAAQSPSSTGTTSSHLAGLVGMFTGFGALLALVVFLPLPTRFQRAGYTPAGAVAAAFYVVGAIAIVVAIAVSFGLRNLPGESGKSLRNLFHQPRHKRTSASSLPDGIPSSAADLPTPPPPTLSYPRLLLTSLHLAIHDPSHIGLAYLGGIVARASSVAISLFLPLYTHAYFIESGQCSAGGDGDGAGDIKHACPRAYLLAAALSGTSQLVALLCAPLFGWLGAHYSGGVSSDERTRKGLLQHSSSEGLGINLPLLLAAIAGLAGNALFALLRSPDPKSAQGNGGVFLIVALMGFSQIGCIVLSLGLLARGVSEVGGSADEEQERRGAHARQRERHEEARPGREGEEEAEALLGADAGADVEAEAEARSDGLGSGGSSSSSSSRAHLKGSLAGCYSLFGGAGILVLTKFGGWAFDACGPAAPFWILAAFEAILALGVVGVGGWGWVRRVLLRGRGRGGGRTRL